MQVKNFSVFDYIKTNPVKKIQKPDKEEFNITIASRFVPAILSGCMEDWLATEKWTKDFILENFGEVEEFGFRGKSDRKLLKISDYLDGAGHSDEVRPYYLENCQFHLTSEMRNDYRIPDYFKSFLDEQNIPIRYKLSWIKIGISNARSSLSQNFFNTSSWSALFSGRKIWLFYAPDDLKFLYNGTVDPFAVDQEKFPEFEKAVPQVCIQEPGEIVFIPSNWWFIEIHETAGFCLSENFINEINIEDVRSTLKYHNRTQELHLLESCIPNTANT